MTKLIVKTKKMEISLFACLMDPHRKTRSKLVAITVLVVVLTYDKNDT